MRAVDRIRLSRKALTPLAGALLLLLAAAAPARAEQKSLLTPDGTLYSVQSGLYGALEPGGTQAKATDYVIEWSAVTQGGQSQSGLIPGTATSDVKDQFDLAY